MALNHIAAKSIFKPTTAAGDARRLAAKAVREGHDTVVAAGGDGTLNEVLNGIGDVEEGFKSTRLGCIPLGTVNVFARELGIPLKPVEAWTVIERGYERAVDLPWIRWDRNGETLRQYFTQLAGAGLDARAIELANWSIKKRIGPLAYVLAGLRALCESPALLVATVGDQSVSGELVLIGNGKLYGGDFQVFPDAGMRDGLLEVCVFPRVGWMTLLRCGLPLVFNGRVPSGVVQRLRGSTVQLQSKTCVPVEVDGELAGHLPVTVGVKPLGLRVIVPG